MNVAGRVLLNRYRLGQRLGRGGMADVYQALDLRLQRPVAVKVLHPLFAADPEFVERFEREAQSVAALNHPNIVAVYDRGVDGESFLVMELVEGGSLAQLLRQHGTLSIEHALTLARDVLAALAHAHARGLVHCDVKAENVLMTAEGRVKLADFGIARAAAAAALTRAHQDFGSVHYLAPERLAGQPATPAADLYSVGVLLYLMLTARLPFLGDDIAMIVAQHQQHPPRPPSELRPDLPGWLEQATLRALSKEPADRFPSAGAMELSLRGGWSDVGPELPTVRIATSDAMTVRIQRDSTPPGGRAEVGGKWARRLPRRPAFVLAALVILVVLGLTWSLAAQQSGLEESSTPASSRASVPSTSPPKAAPTSVTKAEAPTPASAVAAATPTSAGARAIPTTAPATPVPTDAAPRQTIDQLRALVANSSAAAWKENDKKREFVKQLDEFEKRLAENKPRDARDRIRDLAKRASDMARHDELDGRLADQIIEHLEALASQL